MSETYVFCPQCAAPLEPLTSGRDAGLLACPTGHFVHYVNPAVTVMGFIERDGRFLVLRRAIEPYAGRWEMPGGFVEAGEAPRDALRREAREEAQLELEVGAVIGAYAGSYGDGGKATVDVAYRAVALGDDDVVLSDESREHAWVPLAEFPELAFVSERVALADLRAAS